MNSSRKKINLIPVIMRVVILISLILSTLFIILSLVYSNQILGIIGVILLILTNLIAYRFITLTSTRDDLTRISNSDRLILKAVSLMIRKKLPDYTALFINICDLKYVNAVAESLGGDLVLAEYAAYLNSHVKKGEYLCRMGGDNFFVLLFKDNVEEFLSAIEKINITISPDGIPQNFVIRSRVGLYSLKEGDTVGDMLGNSNIALASIKETHDGYICWYSPSMSKKTVRDKEASFLFRDALEAGEFHVYFQPRVDAAENVLCGAEALARWIRDDHIIAPDMFIPALEKSGLITELDFYVFEQVCKSLQRWKAEGKRLVPISSNFSKYHLRDYDFATHILEILSKYDVDKSMIELELTESVGTEDFDRLKEFLKKMHDADIRVAIDDFGVGYSSLELLKDQNFNIVKIDKSFVDDICIGPSDNVDKQLISNIVSTCRNMNKYIVCEGVESKEQRDILLSMNCPEIQGYLYDKPLPIHDFEQRLNNFKYS